MGRIKVPDTGDDGPIVDRLMDRVARLAGDVQQQGGQQQALARTVTALSEAVAQLVGDDQDDAGGARPLGWWQAIDPAAAQQSLTELTRWLDAVWCQWRDGDDVLSACWPWHWPAVVELWATYQAWTWANKPDKVMARTEWLDRIRPRTVERLRHLIGNCTPARHVTEQDGGPPLVYRRSGKAHAAAGALSDVAAAYANGTALPYPSPELIQAARPVYGGIGR